MYTNATEAEKRLQEEAREKARRDAEEKKAVEARMARESAIAEVRPNNFALFIQHLRFCV